jgi:hypothetical protein
LPSAHDMDGLKLATLDTLQHRLTRDAESTDCLTLSTGAEVSPIMGVEFSLVGGFGVGR